MAALTQLPETQRRTRGHRFYPPQAVAAKIPPIGATQEVEDLDALTVRLHYFTGGCDWWLVELDPETGLGWGFCQLTVGEGEWGYVSLPELEAVRPHREILDGCGVARFRLQWVVERDCHWQPRVFAAVTR